jgi:ABC-type glycerol-3-phosphate transport system substrate-binding protein
MKKLLILLVVLLARPALSAVAQAGTTEPLVMEMAHFSFFGDVAEYPELKDQFIREFEKKFGIRIKMNLIPRNNYLEKLNLMVASGELKGIIRVFSPADVLWFYRGEAIEPLDDYLSDNPVYKRESVAIDNVFQYDGKTLALMDGYTGNIFSRGWRKDWLDELGLKVPETVDQLYEAAKAFTEKDPDGNGVADTTGITGASVGWNIQDIFHAYDAKINNTGGNSVAWDPVTQAWDDSMLKPGMVQALTMLNRLYRNKYLDNEFATNTGSKMRDRLLSGKYGGTFYWNQWHLGNWLKDGLARNVPTAQVAIQTACRGTRTTLLNQYVAGGNMNVLIKGTPRAREVVNAFVNIFLGDQTGNLMGRFGIPAVTYRMQGNTVVQLKNAAGAVLPTAGLCSPIPQFDIDKFPAVPDGTPEEQKAAMDWQILNRTIINKGLADRLLFESGGRRDAPYADAYTMIQNDLNRLFNEAVIKATTGELPVKEAIRQYRVAAKKIGAQKAIDDANSFLAGVWNKPSIKTTWKY